jgi:hypothetical protein
MIGTGDSKRYISIRGLFDLEFPTKWSLIGDDEGMVSLSSSSGMAAVTVSAAKHRSQAVVVDACEQLQRYMSQLAIEPDRFRQIDCSLGLATGEYTNEAGVYWRIQFKALANVVVLATYNREFSGSWQDEDREALAILSSIKVKAKAQ